MDASVRISYEMQRTNEADRQLPLADAIDFADKDVAGRRRLDDERRIETDVLRKRIAHPPGKAISKIGFEAPGNISRRCGHAADQQGDDATPANIHLPRPRRRLQHGNGGSKSADFAQCFDDVVDIGAIA